MVAFLFSIIVITTTIVLIIIKENLFRIRITLFIDILLLIFSAKNINRIKGIKNKTLFFQYIKLLFILSILSTIFGRIIAMVLANMDLSIKFDAGKIFIVIFIVIMGIDAITYIYKMFLIIKVIIKKYK